MNYKKITALLLASVMAISTLAGCGSSDEPAAEDTAADTKVEESADTDAKAEETAGITFPLEEPYEVDVYVMPGNDEMSFEDTAIFKHMEEMTNVKMNVTNLTLEAFDTTITTEFATGDYPDVLIKCNIGGEKAADYGEQGILIDLLDYKEYMPNYTGILDERNLWNNALAEDGSLYAFGEIGQQSAYSPWMWINTTWLEKAGMDMPTNPEEFYEVLKYFKENDMDGDGDPNNEIPFAALSADIFRLQNIFPYYGIRLIGQWGGDSMNEDASAYEYYPVTEKYKEAVRWMAKFYEEGLLWDQTFTSSLDVLAGRIQSGEVTVGCMPEWDIERWMGKYDPAKEDNLCLQYEIMPPWEGIKIPSSCGYSDGAAVITDACEHPEIMVAWLDYLYSEEGSLIAGYGTEGDTYDLVDGNKIKMRTAENPSATYGEDVAKAQLNMGGYTCKPLKNYLNDYEVYYDTEANPINGYTQKITKGWLDNGLLAPAYPSFTLNAEESTRVSDISADIDAYYDNYLAEVVTGKIDLDETWDEYLQKMEEMGVSELVEIKNTAYQRYLSK